MKQPSPPALRLLAALIDMLLAAVPGVLMLSTVFAADRIENILTNLLSAVITLLIVPAGYQLLCGYLTARAGGSPGKLLTGLAVVGEDGNRVPLPVALFRTFIGPLIAGQLFGLGYLFILKDPERRGWHDMASGTRVIRRGRLAIIGVISLAALLVIHTYTLSWAISGFRSNFPLYRSVLIELYESSRDDKTEDTAPIPDQPMPDGFINTEPTDYYPLPETYPESTDFDGTET